MQFKVLLGAWLVVLIALGVVAGIRRALGRREDDHLHMYDTDRQLIPAQVAIAHKLDTLDRWKAILLIGTVVIGLALAFVHAYRVWQAGPAMM